MLSPYVHINPWDVMLVIVVSVQATILACLQQPRWKAFIISLPVPFTLMALAAGRPLDATNVMGLFFLLLFTHAVRLLYQKLRIPIIPAIILSALGYCMLGFVAAQLLPKTDAAFWVTWVFVFLLGAYLSIKLPDRTEPEYRTQLPVWIKLPIIAGVVLILILVRNILQGFATVFPMVGVIAVYESRYCLWTIGRQIPVVMVSMSTMMAVAYLVQQQWSFPMALLAGWCAFLLVFGLITIRMWAKAPNPA
ncbi:MAG: hypothetical protein ABIL11_19350 [Chloroflexota bacterium]